MKDPSRGGKAVEMWRKSIGGDGVAAASNCSWREKRPRADSNCALRLRRPTLCPLSYGGGRRNFITCCEVACNVSIYGKSNNLCLCHRCQSQQLGAKLLDDADITLLIAKPGELFLFMG